MLKRSKQQCMLRPHQWTYSQQKWHHSLSCEACRWLIRDPPKAPSENMERNLAIHCQYSSPNGGCKSHPQMVGETGIGYGSAWNPGPSTFESSSTNRSEETCSSQERIAFPLGPHTFHWNLNMFEDMGPKGQLMNKNLGTCGSHWIHWIVSSRVFVSGNNHTRQKTYSFPQIFPEFIPKKSIEPAGSSQTSSQNTDPAVTSKELDRPHFPVQLAALPSAKWLLRAWAKIPVKNEPKAKPMPPHNRTWRETHGNTNRMVSYKVWRWLVVSTPPTKY